MRNVPIQVTFIERSAKCDRVTVIIACPPNRLSLAICFSASTSITDGKNVSRQRGHGNALISFTETLAATNMWKHTQCNLCPHLIPVINGAMHGTIVSMHTAHLGVVDRVRMWNMTNKNWKQYLISRYQNKCRACTCAFSRILSTTFFHIDTFLPKLVLQCREAGCLCIRVKEAECFWFARCTCSCSLLHAHPQFFILRGQRCHFRP